MRKLRPNWYSRRSVGAVLAAMALTVSALAAPLEIGSELPGFSLKNVDGRTVSASDYGSTRALVVVFSCNTCPYSRAYQGRLIQLQKEYGGRGAQFVLINPNDAGKSPGDSYDAMQKRSKEQRYPFPYLHDESQQVARAFGASRTPEVFLFDQNRKLVYRGQIDDNTEESQVRMNHLRSALDILLTGTPDQIQPNTTRSFGCTIKWK